MLRLQQYLATALPSLSLPNFEQNCNPLRCRPTKKPELAWTAPATLWALLIPSSLICVSAYVCNRYRSKTKFACLYNQQLEGIRYDIAAMCTKFFPLPSALCQSSQFLALYSNFQFPISNFLQLELWACNDRTFFYSYV